MNKRTASIALTVAVALIPLLISPTSADEVVTKKWFPGHYLYVIAPGKTENGMSEGARAKVRDNPYFVGYKGYYLWADLETAPGVYDFSRVIKDLDTVHAEGKKLIVMIHNRQFVCGARWPLPAYMQTDPVYEGGVYSTDHDPDNPCKIKPKLYLESVANRFSDLWTALGKAIDKHPALALVQHDETSMPMIDQQPGFNAETYLNNFMHIHDSIGEAFPTTIFAQYVNWRQGMTNAGQDLFMQNLVENNSHGFGGPDMLNVKDGEVKSALANAFEKYYEQYAGIATIAMSSQAESYMGHTAREVYDYGINQLGANFIAWSNINPSNSDAAFSIEDVIKVINEEKGHINTAVPRNLVAPEVPISPPGGVRVITE